MRSWHFHFSWSLSLVLGACASATGKPSEAAVGNLAEREGVLVAAGQGPAHRFAPRQHPPHLAPDVPTPDLAALPRLVTHQCFGFERPSPTPRSSGVGSGNGTKQKRAPTGSSGSGAVGSGSPGAARPMPAPPPVAQAPTRPMPTPMPTPPPASAPARDEAADEGDYGAPAPRSAEPDFDEAARSEESAQAYEQAEMAEPEDPYHDWGASIYLSNDDTMSLSSAQRVLFAIDHFLPLPVEHIRPHELLNYFSFDTAPSFPENDFSVHAEVEAKPGEEGIYTLGLSVAGRPLNLESRRNASLSIVVDRSGSMSDEGRMDYLKYGLTRMTDELKTGDVVNLVLFDHEVCVPFQNFVVGRDSMDLFRNTLARLKPRGSTDVHAGLRRGYELADASYQPNYTNRVVMITDALANTGVTDEGMISLIGQHYDARRIRLSGIGVGREFNDGLLDRLTERGKGAYVFLGSQAEVEAVFGDRFVSLIETIATDVHFQLHLPPSLRMNVFYGEESSTVKEDVQAVHYFAGTSQLFLSDLMAKGGRLRPEDDVMLTIEYEHPETGREMVEEYAFNLGEIGRRADNVRKGRLITSFIDGIHDLALRVPDRFGVSAGSWADPHAYEQCEMGRRSLAEQAMGIETDPEVRRVQSLWEQYCSRYEAAPMSVRRTQPTGRDVWPGAH